MITRLLRSGRHGFLKFASTIGIDIVNAPKINLVVENANWAIYWVGEYIRRGIDSRYPGEVGIQQYPEYLNSRIIHFGTRDIFLFQKDRISKSNRIVATCLHGNKGAVGEFDDSLDRFIEASSNLSAIVTSNRLMEERLLKWGISGDILHRIPLGVDTTTFTPATDEIKHKIRNELGIPKGRFCIGSFQKDGVGWEEGLQPKLVKGPDVLMDTISLIAKEIPVFVLLTGPSRGYVIKRLKEMNVPHAHYYVDDYEEMVRYYRALDLYLMTSREEGGPLCIPESMATGIPVVATDAGMAPDMIRNGENGFMAQSEDYETLANHVLSVHGDAALRDSLIREAAKTVQEYDWFDISMRYYKEVYSPLLDTLG